MRRRASNRFFVWTVSILALLTLAVGGVSQYLAVRSLRSGIGRYAYGKPFGAGTREFKPPGVYVGRVVDLKIYALPTEEMDLPGWQSRYLIRRRTVFREVYEAYYCTDLFDLRDEPPSGPVWGGFPPLGFIDVVHKDDSAAENGK